MSEQTRIEENKKRALEKLGRLKNVKIQSFIDRSGLGQQRHTDHKLPPKTLFWDVEILTKPMRIYPIPDHCSVHHVKYDGVETIYETRWTTCKGCNGSFNIDCTCREYTAAIPRSFCTMCRDKENHERRKRLNIVLDCYCLLRRCSGCAQSFMMNELNAFRLTSITVHGEVDTAHKARYCHEYQLCSECNNKICTNCFGQMFPPIRDCPRCTRTCCKCRMNSATIWTWNGYACEDCVKDEKTLTCHVCFMITLDGTWGCPCGCLTQCDRCDKWKESSVVVNLQSYRNICKDCLDWCFTCDRAFEKRRKCEKCTCSLCRTTNERDLISLTSRRYCNGCVQTCVKCNTMRPRTESFCSAVACKIPCARGCGRFVSKDRIVCSVPVCMKNTCPWCMCKQVKSSRRRQCGCKPCSDCQVRYKGKRCTKCDKNGQCTSRAQALLAGFHKRVGKDCFLRIQQRKSSLFDTRVIGLILRLAGTIFPRLQ